jgi:thiamine biosynthesis lipoprotein
MPDRPVSRRDALRITAFAGLSTAFAGGLGMGVLRHLGLRRVRETRTHMGTLVTLTVVCPDAAEARDWIARAFGEMARLEGVLSRHRPDTAVGRLNASGRLVGAPPELTEVLGRAAEASRLSRGAFDVTVAPLLDLYERSFADGAMPPSTARVAEALELVDYRAVRIDSDVITFDTDGMSITLDGIAKGFIVDRTIDVLVTNGAERVMVDAGGDMATAGPGSSHDPWTVGIQDPHADGIIGLVRLGGECIATSGDYMATFTEDRRFHHILDPRTGRSPEETSAVSVIASSAMEADALSTALLVLGPRDGISLLEELPGAEGVMVTKDGRRVRSSGLARHAV